METGPLKNFYSAEEYHQNYLEKNPNGYCHIPRAEMELFSRLRIDPGDYQKPVAESIRDKLTAEQYRVTQESGTERAFTGEFWDKFEKGIYVDVVTGEPLFSSTDKYESGCGWPAFTKPIEEPAMVELEDLSHGSAAQRSEAVPEILTLVMCSPAIRSRPTACATALWRVPAGAGPFDADSRLDAAKNHRCDHCGRSRDYCRPAGVCLSSRKNAAAHTGSLLKGGAESAGAAAGR